MNRKTLVIFMFISVLAHYYVDAKDEDSYTKICDLHEELAKKGVTSNQYLLGVCYQFGRGRNKNIQQALHWFNKSSENGYLAAKESINSIYLFVNLLN